jgi:hypothetical protein
VQITNKKKKSEVTHFIFFVKGSTQKSKNTKKTTIEQEKVSGRGEMRGGERRWGTDPRLLSSRSNPNEINN